MGTSNFDQLLTVGTLQKMARSSSTAPDYVPEMTGNSGPAIFYQGSAFPDPRFNIFKDRVQGFPGSVRGFAGGSSVVITDRIPSALSTSNIAAAQAATSGTAFTLATAVALGVCPAVPFQSFAGSIVTSGVTLDMAFAWGNCTSGSTTIPVADSTQFVAGMPLVIGGVGNAAGTTCLLTYVASITDATNIVVGTAPSATNTTAPIGIGNVWPVTEFIGSTLASNTPTGYLPYLAAGIGLLFDAVQGVARGVSITGTAAGCTGGTVLVSGYDIFGKAMSELVTVTAAATTSFSTKCFKHISSVTPQFTDAQTYTVGTSDLFGANLRTNVFDQQSISWNGSAITQGWTAGVTTTASTTTGDTRGRFQVGANGPDSDGAPGGPSNGSLSSLAMTGRRLYWLTRPSLRAMTFANIDSAVSLFGVAQA